MRFIDEAVIHVASGRGGDGCSSFRREKFVPLGGPDGGDGGRGGDVVLVATTRRNTLLDLRGHAIWRARSGQPGKGNQRTGGGGEDTEIEVPVGTRVFDVDTDQVLADLTEDGQRWVAARGGRGGMGNASFKSSTNRAPTETTPGGEAEERHLRLELMLMADAGLVGFPNAGKSTLISRISSARPRVADYPFTTLVPNLGVVDMGLDGSYVVADVPGLIQGAAEGAGLGHRFLRHVQRTRLLLHLVSLGSFEQEVPVQGDAAVADPGSPGAQALARYRAIRAELAAFDPGLAARPELVVLTKADIVPPEERDQALAALQAEVGADRVLVISAVTGQGIPQLKHRVHGELKAMLAE
ncbi:GTPase ObgE [Myxococcota bacterium]|nr:GTPase ObgE [Myxococcota bacterium]